MTEEYIQAIWERLAHSSLGLGHARTYEETMNDRNEWRFGLESEPQIFRAVMKTADAEFIANAPDDIAALLNEVTRLRAGEKRVRELHKSAHGLCSYDWHTYPCPTIRALDDELSE
jgi:hypothetical protein